MEMLKNIRCKDNWSIKFLGGSNSICMQIARCISFLIRFTEYYFYVLYNMFLLETFAIYATLLLRNYSFILIEYKYRAYYFSISVF